MSDDLVARLRDAWHDCSNDAAALVIAAEAKVSAHIAELEAEVDVFKGFRTEALARINEYKAEVERLTDEMSTMHRSVVHECCERVSQLEAEVKRLTAALANLAPCRCKWESTTDAPTISYRCLRCETLDPTLKGATI